MILKAFLFQDLEVFAVPAHYGKNDSFGNGVSFVTV